MIKSINLRNIYSFGDGGTPELKNFTQFNLFIGKNGSGKSSVFRVLCDLDIRLEYGHARKTFTPMLAFDSMRWGIHYNIKNPSIGRTSPFYGHDLRIEHDRHTMEFENSVHVQGDFTLYKGTYIKLDTSQYSLKQKLVKVDNSKLSDIIFFSFKYIFGVDVSIGGGVVERFTKVKKETKGSMGRSIVFDQWSSGYSAVLNLLLDFFADNKIVCIDEPELHLEPRALRNLIDILMWRCNGDVKVKQAWDEWFEDSTAKNSDIWKDGNELEPLSNKQIFIASHSPVLINRFLSRDDCSIYEFDHEFQHACNPNHSAPGNDSLVSVVRKIHFSNESHSILDSLGARGSDLLQTNGIVWVEGPSDVIYIRKWLEMYADENGKRRLGQGIDYEFQMFGGTLLSHLQIDGEKNEDAADHLVRMFSFSRNAYVVIDSDLGKSKFEPAKKRIETEWLKHAESRPDELGLWYDPAGKIKTIEYYITNPDSLSLLKRTYSKPKNANDCVRIWGGLSLADFKADLPLRIEDIYNKITAWGDQ